MKTIDSSFEEKFLKMESKKSKMCKVRLRRLRPDLVDKLKTKRAMARADLPYISSSSESEDEDSIIDEFVDKISVQLKSPLAFSNSKDFDPFVLLTEAQAALNLSNEKENRESSTTASAGDEKMDTEHFSSNNASTNLSSSSSKTVVEKVNKKPKLRKKQKSRCYPPMEECGGGGAAVADKFLTMLKPPTLEHDLIYYHSDDQGPCSYNCNHSRAAGAAAGASTAAVLALAPTDRRSSSGSSSSLISDKSFAKLLHGNCISVVDDENPPTALSKILSIKEFDPLAPQQIVAIIIKKFVSLTELSHREDNVITVDLDKRRIKEFSAMSAEEKKNCRLNPFLVNIQNLFY